MNDDVIIKTAFKDELPILEEKLGHKNIPWFHKKKLEEQEKGECLWLIAWKDDFLNRHN